MRYLLFSYAAGVRRAKTRAVSPRTRLLSLEGANFCEKAPTGLMFVKANVQPGHC